MSKLFTQLATQVLLRNLLVYIFPVSHLKNRNFMPLVINQINDAILALAYAIAIRIT